MIFNCLFCYQELPPATDHYYRPSNLYLDYDCEPCQAHFTCTKNDNELYCYILESEPYTIVFYVKRGNSVIHKKIYYKQPVKDYTHHLQLILKLDFHPPITPKNIAHKLKTYLTFL